VTPDQLKQAVAAPGKVVVSGAPEGLDGTVAGELARAAGDRPVLHVARDDQRAAMLAEAIRFFHPDVEILPFPAWDCLPYDRVSPAAEILSRRLNALTRLAGGELGRPAVILATANSVLQRVPPRDVIKAASFSAAPGNRVNTEELQDYLVKNGFSRTGTVVDPGDYAIRGGIIDIFPPGHEEPVRLDFFGDTLESCAASTLRRSAPPISSSSSSWMQPARYC
jgi:transcription-repair coupling factor (superfamily II helicase)